MTPPPIILLAGPTAAGKSFLSVKIADFLKKTLGRNSEIINADATQLYNELKILTAFPTADQIKCVPHKLFGVLSPNDSSSVASWIKMAMAEIKRIRAEQNVPIICGGTGLYLKAITDGISDIPKVPAEIRQEVRHRFAKIGRDEFFDELKKLDPESRVSKGDSQRLLRAYEIALFTGKPMAYWWNQKNEPDDFPKLSILSFVLNPLRAALNQACQRRICSMIDAGAVEEVRDFRKKYENYSGSLVNAVGYEEISLFLGGEISLENCVEKMQIRTRQYAKRQSTWFRNQMKNACFLDNFGY
ncbi:MAG: tRNA (adenosine(37)-N6)-dimethylallyltransferase MiaA, partial [Holosporaceae bacterium]|nr:tRNA (adenosine(37)-N6)-dimethylallyltransferase MiaA [Holosporaceae bacterium]